MVVINLGGNGTKASEATRLLNHLDKKLSNATGIPEQINKAVVGKKAYAPGQHGNMRRRGKKSEYGVQLDESGRIDLNKILSTTSGGVNPFEY